MRIYFVVNPTTHSHTPNHITYYMIENVLHTITSYIYTQHTWTGLFFVWFDFDSQIRIRSGCMGASINSELFFFYTIEPICVCALTINDNQTETNTTESYKHPILERVSCLNVICSSIRYAELTIRSLLSFSICIR